MKKLFFLIPFILVQSLAFTQINLVNNPGFEEHTTCEIYFGAIDTNTSFQAVVPFWISSNVFGTPDYFNTCYTSIFDIDYAVPHNFITYQLERNDNNGYIGIGIIEKFSENYDLRNVK